MFVSFLKATLFVCISYESASTTNKMPHDKGQNLRKENLQFYTLVQYVFATYLFRFSNVQDSYIN